MFASWINKSILLLTIMLLGGCAFSIKAFDKPQKQFYYLNPNKDITAIGRVALVELNNESSYPKVSFDITQALYSELLKKQYFGVRPIYQNDAEWKNVQVKNGSAFSLEQLEFMKNNLNCDAIAVGTVIQYHPYPHLMIGLRLQLIDLRDSEVIWGMEQIWDSTDKTTQRKIAGYFSGQKTMQNSPLDERLVGLSSIEFLKFVAFETAETFKK